MIETSSPSLSVVLPSFNNGAQALASVRAIEAVCPKDTEIIVVIDGSNVQSRVPVENLCRSDTHVQLLRHPVCRGKGASVRDGILSAHGRYIAFMDADLGIAPSFLMEFLSIASADPSIDLIIGYRRRYHTSTLRHCTHVLYHWFVRLLFGIPFRDTQAAIKIFRADVAKALFSNMRTEGYAFDVDILLRAFERNCVVREVPVVQNQQTKTSMTWRKLCTMIEDTCALYRMHERGLASVRRWRRIRRMMLHVLSGLVGGIVTIMRTFPEGKPQLPDAFIRREIAL